MAAGTATPARTSAGSFRQLSQVGEWAKQTQTRARQFSLHVDLTTTHIELAMRRGAAKRMLDKAVTGWRVKRATRQFRRAAAHMDAAADCMSKGWLEIQTQFADLINPGRTPGAFDWEH